MNPIIKSSSAIVTKNVVCRFPLVPILPQRDRQAGMVGGHGKQGHRCKGNNPVLTYAREHELMTETHAKLSVVGNCSRSSLSVSGEGDTAGGWGVVSRSRGWGRQTVHRERESGAVLRPNSESKEETSASGQGFNINSTQFFLI